MKILEYDDPGPVECICGGEFISHLLHCPYCNEVIKDAERQLASQFYTIEPSDPQVGITHADIVSWYDDKLKMEFFSNNETSLFIQLSKILLYDDAQKRWRYVNPELVLNGDSSLNDIKLFLEDIEHEIVETHLTHCCHIVNDGRSLHVYITNRLVSKLGRKWKSKEFLTAFKNVRYGFDPQKSRSERGRDGIYLLDRNYKVKNMMMKKIFDHYMDKKGSGFTEIANYLNKSPADFLAIRVVSHHMRILGVMCMEKDDCHITLVDYDDTEEGK